MYVKRRVMYTNFAINTDRLNHKDVLPQQPGCSDEECQIQVYLVEYLMASGTGPLIAMSNQPF